MRKIERHYTWSAARIALAGTLAVTVTTAALGQTPAPPVQCQPTEITPTSGPVVRGFKGEAVFTVQACAPGDVLVGQGQSPVLRRASDNDPGPGYFGSFNVKPCDLPGGSDLPDAKLAISFVSANPAARVAKTILLGPDTEKPSLKTTSVPPKGSKVKPGATIKVRMEASEEYSDDRLYWQTGVKKILLRDESRNQDMPGHFESSGAPQPCRQKAWKRWLEASYTVPENPPPIIRLRAIAEDFAGNKDDDVAEFPTGEVWKGTVKLERDGHNPRCSAIKSETEFTIAVADNGAVTGTGTVDHSSWTCEGGYTAPASRTTLVLGGKKQGGTFHIVTNDWNPKNNPVSRLPGGQWIVQVGQGSKGEGTFEPGRMTGVVFRIKLECQNCGHP
jgi:hypothetical protein